jgi:2-keto-4-pentenoate hydratase/2-oxohepta-3-ene-1,7-dioic acid hydratase in catechol pathway
VLNGTTVQDGTTAYVFSVIIGSCALTILDRISDQLFTVRQTIAFLSQGTTLEPGSIILTGTPKGVGFARKPPLYLKHGDNVSVWLGCGIGTLANEVIEEKDSIAGKL